MSESFPESVLRAAVCRHVLCDAEKLRFVRPRTGKFNTTYYVDGCPRPLVLRIAPPDDAGFVFYERRMMAQEPGIHAAVRERTSAPVAEILAYDSSRECLDRDYLLMERLPGLSMAECFLDGRQVDSVLYQIGGYLRQIHAITSDLYGYLGEQHCMEPQKTWAGAFEIMWAKLAADVARAGYYDSSEEKWVVGLLKSRLDIFERPVRSSLLHMDVWSQNILVDAAANVTGLVDFDRALWGDPEIEFAVLDYCGISEPAFWNGYGAERDRSAEAEMRRAFYLAYEVQKYIVIRHWRHRDPARALDYKNRSLQILRSL